MAAVGLAGAVSAAEAEEEGGESRFFIGASGALMLPQGGSSLRHLGGAGLRGGWYLNDDIAFEGDAAWLEDFAGLGADVLWHWQGSDLYGDLFGYSRFDPFFTTGARGWIGRGAGQVGPTAGVGAFYHLTDNWSLRADAQATLGLDTRVEMLYTLQCGVQYAF